MKTDKKVRQLREGFGVQGVRIDLTMAHIYSLMALQTECQMAKNDPSLDPRAVNLVHQMSGVLDFIIGDLQSPFSENLWQEEKAE